MRHRFYWSPILGLLLLCSAGCGDDESQSSMVEDGDADAQQDGPASDDGAEDSANDGASADPDTEGDAREAADGEPDGGDAADPDLDSSLNDPDDGSDQGSDAEDTAQDSPAEDIASDGDAGTGDGWLYTSGNGIFLPNGDRFHGRGANIHDTRSCNACAWSAPDVDEVLRRIDLLVDGWGANFLRLTLESYGSADGRVHWANPLTDNDYLADVRTIVDHIGGKPGVYVLLSLWIDPTFDDNGWPTDETNDVWAVLVEEFRDDAHVLFGIVNEPEANWNGDLDAQVWTRMNSAVTAIRQAEAEGRTGEVPRHIIAVQGTRAWARELAYYVDNPITAGGGANIAYETHVYDAQSEFADRFETPGATLPVIIGEFGPADGFMTLDDCSNLMMRAEAAQIPYLAWTFHMRCPPNLLVDNSSGGCGVDMALEPTEWGTLLMNRLAVDY